MTTEKFKYIAFDYVIGEYASFETEEEAKEFCNACIDAHRDESWPDECDMRNIGYAKITACAVETSRILAEEYYEECLEDDPDFALPFDYICDYKLKEVT